MRARSPVALRPRERIVKKEERNYRILPIIDSPLDIYLSLTIFRRGKSHAGRYIDGGADRQ